MTLIDYGRILLRRGWIILLLALLAAASAFLISRVQTPVYRSTQLVLIQPSRNDLGLTDATTRQLESLVVYLNSTFRAQAVIDELNLDLLAGDLRSNATIAANRNNLTVQIDIDLPDCELASRVATAWGNQLVRYREIENQTVRQEDRVDALLVDVATCGQIAPRTSLNVIAGALIGVILGAVVVFVLEYLESAIFRRRDDVERILGLPVLAAIPESDRA